MHIALISHQFGFGDGQGRVNYEIVRAALNAGFQITIIGESCDEGLRSNSDLQFIYIRTSKLPTRFLKNLSFAFRSACWVGRNRKSMDLIQANGFITFAAADLVAAHFVHGAWLRSPYASASHSLLHIGGFYQRLYTALNAGLEQMAFRRSKRVVAVSQNVAGELTSIGVPLSKVAVIFNGVDVNEFSPSGKSRASRLVSTDVPLFLFCGDLRTKRKNLDSVLRSLAEVDAVHLAVAGDSAGSPFPALAQELGIQDRVHFLGFTREMSELMRSVDAFVFPSRYDPLGLVVLEAMACGLPVITAQTTGASAVLDAPEWTIEDPEDTASLTLLIRRLAEDPSLRAQVGQRNRIKALEHSWDAMAASYINLYREVYAEGARPGATGRR